MQPAPHKRRVAAFTLIELLVALALIAATLAIAAPRVAASLELQRSRVAIRGVASYLAQARADAALGGTQTVVTIDTRERVLASTARGERLRLPAGLEVELTIAVTEKLDEQRGAIRFFADGTATGGRIRFAGAMSADVVVHWLTGMVSVSLDESP